MSSHLTANAVCANADAQRCRRDRPRCAGRRAANESCSNGSSIQRWTHPRRRCRPYKRSRRDSSKATRIANRLKPSSIAAKNAILRLYLIPMFGRRRLDAIKNEDVQRLKAQLELKSPKTVNNVLNALSVLLKRAVEWDVIERMPCTVKLLRVRQGQSRLPRFRRLRTARRGRAFDRHPHAARGAAGR